jgi:hypothetical protein
VLGLDDALLDVEGLELELDEGLCEAEELGEELAEELADVDGDELADVDGECDALALADELTRYPLPVTLIVPPLLAEGEDDGDALELADELGLELAEELVLDEGLELGLEDVL